MRDPRFNHFHHCGICVNNDTCTMQGSVSACSRFYSMLTAAPKRKKRKVQHIEDMELPEYIYV